MIYLDDTSHVIHIILPFASIDIEMRQLVSIGIDDDVSRSLPHSVNASQIRRGV